MLDLAPAPATDADRATVQQRRQEDPGDPNDPGDDLLDLGHGEHPEGGAAVPLRLARGHVDAPRVVTEDVLLNPFPMVNMAGISGMLLPWRRTECVLVQHHPFHLPMLLGQIAQERITYTVAPPALLLHDEALLAATDLSSLSRIGSGSVPLQPAMVRGWQKRFGIDVINFFGSNEGVGLLCSPTDVEDPDERARYFPRYGAPGRTWSTRVAQWVGVRLVDLTTGQDITEAGRPGELRISGPTVFAGYLDGAQRVSPFDDQELPERLEVREVLPRNPVGKILKRSPRRPAPTE